MKTFIYFLSTGVAAIGLIGESARANSTETTSEPLEFFEKKVRPLFVERCYNCHSADTKPAGGLRVDDRNSILLGGDSGPAIVPGDAENSLIIKRIRQQDAKRRMPRDSEALSEPEINILEKWIADGGAWPREKLPANLNPNRPEYAELKKSHWAWQPLRKPEVPLVTSTAWPRSDIDRFVLSKLESRKLRPVSDADRGTLIRRLSFDLTGLPPSPEEIEAFEKDPSPETYVRLVDRLLASAAFGERWGRHWLDVARYGESTGPSRNIPYPHAWKYRNYVIDSINRDVPFDRFIQEQIAGDLLPATNAQERDRLLTATGFLALGVKDVNQRFKVRFLMDNVDEQIDTVSRSVLGLTVSCARCHDHKFDPISTADYYSLAGIFTSTDDCAGVRNKMGGGGLDYYDPKMLLTLSAGGDPIPIEKVEKLQADVDEAKKAWDEIRGTPEGLKPDPDGRPAQRKFRLKYEKLQGELLALTDPGSRGFAAHGVREGKPQDTEIRIRGEAERLGPPVPRGVLTTFSVPGYVTKIEPGESGRRELATWLTSSNNPLTSRVFVNRAWQYLFGEGIVSTVDNLGVKGDAPSNPELLDYLATHFVANGWSIKKLVRTLVLTRAYQLSSEGNEENRQIDPANRLVWRHSPRRLEAEEIRDAMLASSGRLELKRAEQPVAKPLKMVEMRDNGCEARGIHEKADTSRTRSIYLPLLRGVIPKALEAFDPVEQTLVTGRRETTTVPTQSLYLLNSTFVRKAALDLGERVLVTEQATSSRVPLIYQLVLGRRPSLAEIERAQIFLSEYEASYSQFPASIVPSPKVAAIKRSETTADAAAANPDDVDRTDDLPAEDVIVPKSAETAAWMSLAQALYASAEFRFVR